MRRIKRFGPIVWLAVAVAVAPAFAGSVTVGRFYTQLAQAKHLASADAAAAEVNIRGAGFDLPQLALDKALTEADLTAISSVLGVAVTTHRPTQPISESLVEVYFSVFAAQLRAPAKGIGDPLSINSDDPGDDNNDQGHRPPHSRHKP